MNVVSGDNMSEWTKYKRGPRIEPWGTPQVSGPTEVETSLMAIEKVLFDKYDLV